MDERYENDYENTANQWEETNEGGRVTYRERNTRQLVNEDEEFQEAPRRPRRSAQGESRRPYEPTGTREYRASSRPGRARGTHTAGVAAGGEGIASFSQVIMLMAVAILAVISILVGIVSCATSGGSQGEAVVDTPAATTAAANVEAAEKTTDENGIVHGTTEDGTAFTIVQAKQQAAAGTEGSASSEATQEGDQQQAADNNDQQAAEGDAAAATKEKASFAAVGDQVASDYALELADGYAGEAGDGKYDFKPFYQEVKGYLAGFDMKFINQETALIGGQENYDVAGYPNFISPEACADAIVDTGFNMVSFDSNHSYDAGTEGIEYSQKVWAKHPQIVLSGSYATQQDRETVHMIESNGIRFALLSYSYGDNTYEDVSKEPNNYYAVPFVKDDAAADIARAKKVADAVIVYMHWGDEYTADLNANQKDWAQWLADQDVDLVIGSHAHNIQPVEYYTGTSGNKLPVVFGLGDFVSGWTITDTILSGIFTCDFVRQDTGRVSVENPQWHPTIEWSDGTGQTYVRMLENMTVDQINANTRTEDVPNSFAHVYSTTNSVITQIPVEWGADAAEKAEKATSDSSSESSSASGAAAGAAAANASSDDDNDDSDATNSANGYVDEDEDGYDDNTDEWIGGDDEEGGDVGYVDEDGDGYDDNTDEWIGGDDEADYEDEGYTDDEEDDGSYDDEEEEE